MKHDIPFLFKQDVPLPIPHFLGFPDYTPDDTYDLIVPAELSVSAGDLIYGIDGNDGVKRWATKVLKIIERRSAKGNWSMQQVHNNPDFIRFVGD